MMFLKNPRQENPALLKLARRRPCLVRVSCEGQPSDTTVAAHSNSQKHGKGMARKADDQYTVWACARRHSWLDGSYSATGEERQAAFNAAHKRQMRQWSLIAYGGDLQLFHDRKAAAWALDRIAESEKGAS
jgi:hypothetical protein